jgi:hypothetical protein
MAVVPVLGADIPGWLAADVADCSNMLIFKPHFCSIVWQRNC